MQAQRAFSSRSSAFVSSPVAPVRRVVLAAVSSGKGLNWVDTALDRSYTPYVGPAHLQNATAAGQQQQQQQRQQQRACSHTQHDVLMLLSAVPFTQWISFSGQQAGSMLSACAFLMKSEGGGGDWAPASFK
jgi:hypothetical protein